MKRTAPMVSGRLRRPRSPRALFPGHPAKLPSGVLMASYPHPTLSFTHRADGDVAATWASTAQLKSIERGRGLHRLPDILTQGASERAARPYVGCMLHFVVVLVVLGAVCHRIGDKNTIYRE